jgi:hypothetical protein
MNVQYLQGQSGEIISKSQTSTPSCDATVFTKTLFNSANEPGISANEFFFPAKKPYILNCNKAIHLCAREQ